jgi:hypothetical protein
MSWRALEGPSKLDAKSTSLNVERICSARDSSDPENAKPISVAQSSQDLPSFCVQLCQEWFKDCSHENTLIRYRVFTRTFPWKCVENTGM